MADEKISVFPIATSPVGSATTLAGVQDGENVQVLVSQIAEMGGGLSYPSLAAAVADVIPAEVTAVTLLGYYVAGDGGLAFYKKYGSAPSFPASFQSADGAYWGIVPQESVNFRQLGAVGDDAADDTSALANTLLTSVALGTPWEVPVGTFKTTASLDAGLNGGDIPLPNVGFGSDRNTCTIMQHTDNIPVVKWGGSGGYLHDFGVGYTNQQPSTNTEAVGIEFYAPRFGAVVERIDTNQAYRGFALKQAAVYFGDNFVDGLTINSTFHNNFSGAIMDLRSFGGGSGGLKLGVNYGISRNPDMSPRTVETPFYFQSFSEIVADVMTCLGCAPAQVVFGAEVVSFKLNALHCESLTLSQDFNALVHIDGGHASIFGVSFTSCTVSAPTAFGLIRGTNGAEISVEAVTESGNTVTTPTVVQFLTDNSGNAFYKRNFSVTTFTGLGSFSVPSEMRMIDATPYPLAMTVANLPSSGSTAVNTRILVVDATATTFHSAVAGTGSNTVPVVNTAGGWLIG